jgi:hypothetical protein
MVRGRGGHDVSIRDESPDACVVVGHVAESNDAVNLMRRHQAGDGRERGLVVTREHSSVHHVLDARRVERKNRGC